MNTDNPILTSTTRSWDDLGRRVEMDRHELHCDFRLFELDYCGEKPDWIVEGFVKWDGCSNWMTNPSCMQHFCGREQILTFGETLGRCYDWTKEFFPDL